MEKLLAHPEHGAAIGKHAKLAYATLRDTLRAASEEEAGPAHWLCRFFAKTFRETVSMYRVLYVFSRVLIMRAV